MLGRQKNELSNILDCERTMTIKAILAKFKAVKWIRTYDLRSGYWQILLSVERKPP